MDVRKAIAYVILNPVRAGLVARPEDWPGLITLPSELNGGEIRASRPSWFFNPATNPDEEMARLSLPVQLTESMSHEECLQELQELIEEEIRLIHQGMAARNQKFLGAKKVLKQPRSWRPKKPPLRCRYRLSFICRNPDFRKKELEALKLFRLEYREAFEAFRSGDRDVVFPAGTFKMRRDAGVNCVESPPPLPS